MTLHRQEPRSGRMMFVRQQNWYDGQGGI